MRFCFDKKEFVDVTIQPNKITVYGEDRTLTWLELQTEVNKFFPKDHTHTNKEGALLNAEVVIEAIRSNKFHGLRKYLYKI